MIRFSFPHRSEDYSGRLARLRWRRAFARLPADLDGVLEVPDERSLPAPGAADALAACARIASGAVYPRDSGAAGELRWEPPPVSTLRELENVPPSSPSPAAPLVSTAEGFPARFVVAGASTPAYVAAGFRVLRVRDAFGAREEILQRIPPDARRLIDVGCGTGETAAEARRRNPGLRAEGIERAPGSAARARALLDACHEGDALPVMRGLAARGERFDTLIFADSLEHLRDPFEALEAAAEIATPGAVLIVSVPNAASAPVVSDLLRGRFDPVAAGPEDVGHLRWFTRRSLEELLVETGYADVRCDPVPVPSDDGLGARLAAAGIAVDRNALGAIQWIATARRRGRR